MIMIMVTNDDLIIVNVMMVCRSDLGYHDDDT